MNSVREHCISNLKTVFVEQNTNNLVINIEKSIFNKSLKYADITNCEKSWDNSLFLHIYKQHYSEVILNLQDTTNEFKSSLLSKTLLPKDIANMKAEDFNPEKWKPVAFIDDNVEDGIFQCKKCKSRKTTYYSLQTRSADEPMTNFITCVECTNRWKM